LSNRASDVDSELDPEVVAFLQSVRIFIAGWWGDRCAERQPGCKTCQMWALYDAFELSFDPK
jgi:hypothetical protein